MTTKTDCNDIDVARLFTVGHSTHSVGHFVNLLKAHRIREVIDVRKLPRSRHNPQFALEALAASLEEAGISYRHLPELGGLRPQRSNSPNTGWRNASFRAYADYMQTLEFENALNTLMTLSRECCVAIMCAEAAPWRCHRSLIADALVVRGWMVLHIMDERTLRPHVLSAFAKVEGTRITYPGAAEVHEPQLPGL